MMTPERRKSNRFFGALLTAALTVIGYMMISMWNSKANMLDLQAMDTRHVTMIQGHIQGDQLLRLQDSLWKADEHEMVLELLCHQMPHNPRCLNGR